MDWELMACHSRAMRPGERHTNPLHLPTYKVPGLVLDRSACLVLAAQIGSATEHVVATWLADPVIDRLPMVGRLLRLRQRFGDDRLQVACARAVRFDDISYSTIKRILINGLDRETPPAEATTPSGQTFVRSADELVGHLCGGVAWN
jgi:hypothetical protein